MISAQPFDDTITYDSISREIIMGQFIVFQQICKLSDECHLHSSSEKPDIDHLLSYRDIQA